MIKFSKKIKLIRESRSNPIIKMCDEYDERIEKVREEYRSKFIDTIEKILLSYNEHTGDDVDVMDYEKAEFQVGGVTIYRLVFDSDDIVIEGEKYDVNGDEFEYYINLKKVDTDFASGLLKEISERDYIMKYYLNDLNYNALKKINN